MRGKTGEGRGGCWISTSRQIFGDKPRRRVTDPLPSFEDWNSFIFRMIQKKLLKLKKLDC